MPGVQSSQGSLVTFGGVVVGYLTNCTREQSASSPVDITSAVSPVVGAGENARVCRQYDVTSIEPGTVSVSFWGSPPFTKADLGAKAVLAVRVGAELFQGKAVLLSLSHEASVNKYTTGGCVFQFTGD